MIHFKKDFMPRTHRHRPFLSNAALQPALQPAFSAPLHANPKAAVGLRESSSALSPRQPQQPQQRPLQRQLVYSPWEARSRRPRVKSRPRTRMASTSHAAESEMEGRLVEDRLSQRDSAAAAAAATAVYSSPVRATTTSAEENSAKFPTGINAVAEPATAAGTHTTREDRERDPASAGRASSQLPAFDQTQPRNAVTAAPPAVAAAIASSPEIINSPEEMSVVETAAEEGGSGEGVIEGGHGRSVDGVITSNPGEGVPAVGRDDGFGEHGWYAPASTEEEVG